jgi:hypothetical protein
MSRLESYYQDKFNKELRDYGAWVKVMFGNQFQSGMPDCLTRSVHGVLFHFENKVWKLKRLPTAKDIVGLLEGPQVNVITNEFWGYGIYCPILAFYSDHYCFYHDGTDDVVHTIAWKQLAARFSRINHEFVVHIRSIRTPSFNHKVRSGTA